MRQFIDIRKVKNCDVKNCVVGNKGGRPRKLDARYVRQLIRKLKKLRFENGNFTSKRLVELAGIDGNNVSNRTVRRALNNEGYRYLEARKKGVLKNMDLHKRLAFAKNMKKSFSKHV